MLNDPTATGHDTPRPTATGRDNTDFILSIDEVSERYAKADQRVDRALMSRHSDA